MSQSERAGLEETEWAGPGGRVESERGGEEGGGARWGRAELELDGTHPLTRVNYAARRKGR